MSLTDEEVIEIIIFVLCSTLFLYCVIYEVRNSFHIVLDGLKNAYQIWRAHLILLILQYISLYIRPIWKKEPAPFIFGNKNLCSVWGYLSTFQFILSSILVTLFAFTKARIYFTMRHPWIMPYFTFFLSIGLVIGLLAAAVVKTGPSTQDRITNCVFQTKLSSILFFMYSSHWIIVNLIMISMFWYYTSLLNVSFPSLDQQIRINRRIVPILFLSTVTGLIVFFAMNQSRNGGYIAFATLDHTLNNMVMFYTLFGYVSYNDKEANIQQRIASINFEAEKAATVELGLEVEDYALGMYWVDLPGIHPIRVTHDVVQENNLWYAVVDDEKVMEQIEMSQLVFTCCVCRTFSEIQDRMDEFSQYEFSQESLAE